MKKYIMWAIGLVAFIPAVTFASLTQYYQEKGETLPSLKERAVLAEECGIRNYAGTYEQNILLENCLQESLGASNPLPDDNYDTFLTAPLSTTATTVYVNALPNVSSTVYTIFASDGTTPREKIACTGTATSPNRLTSCMRGIATSPVNGTVTETAGTGLSHSKNARIAITDNINFSGKAIAILNGDQFTSSTAFRLGTGVSTTIKLFFQNTSATSTSSWCGFVGGNIVCSEDGLNTFRLRDGGSGLSASSSAAISITNGFIETNASSTGGIQFDPRPGITSRYLQLKTDNTRGIGVDANGVYVVTSTPFTWSGLNTFTATTSMATSTVASSTISTLNAGQIWLNNKNANMLVGGSTSNADALHTHDKLYSFVSSTATAITYANSTTETQLASSTIPAGSLNTRGFAIMNLHVSDYDTSADSDGILTLRVYYGSTAIASCAIDNNGGVIGAISNMVGDIQVAIMNNGSTASQSGYIVGHFEAPANTNKIYDGTRDAGGGNCDGTGTATIDSTVPQPFRVTGDWNGTDVLTSITISHTIINVTPER